MNLPHLFDTVLETTPSVVPYLDVNRELMAKWATKFQDSPALKVELVWGCVAHKNVLADKMSAQ